jgi:hypothetical protein
VITERLISTEITNYLAIDQKLKAIAAKKMSVWSPIATTNPLEEVFATLTGHMHIR